MWHHLHTLLSGRLQRATHRPQIEGAVVIKAFTLCLHSVLPNDVLAEVRATKLVDGALTVEVGHPAIIQVLRREERALLAQLADGGHHIQRLIFRARRPTPPPE
ncbi:MAG: DUF721 domain-containing protein [Candidatus Kerfeldbacteria bacterium]|nr:DUF721 domain-containing protein [Candidatus Kerfeldbacteria bacterium]